MMTMQSPLMIMPDRNNYIFVPKNNGNQLKLHLSRAPVTALMYTCEPFAFKNYGIGVYKNRTKCSDTKLSVTVVLLGYGVNQNGDSYWNLVNSYGEDWGNAGTFQLARGTGWDKYGGQNGILREPMYNVPQVNKLDYNYPRMEPTDIEGFCRSSIAFYSDMGMSSNSLLS